MCDGDSFTGSLTTKADGKSFGTFDIERGTLEAGSNYKINFTKGTLTVSDKTPQEATVSAMPEKTYGDAGFKVEVTNDKNTDLGKFTFESSNTNVATIDENGNVTIKNAGDTNIIVKRSGNDTYADFEKPQKLTVKKVAITVNADAKSKKVGTDDPALRYQYTGTLVEPDKFTGELKRVEGEAVGKYDILQDTLKINDNYDITYNKAIFEILKKTPQTITVADFGEKTYGDDAFKVNVTPDATSNLSNFTYASDNENVATISADGTIAIKGAGEANITVTEAGNADYAQTSVTKKLTVAKKALEIKVDNIEITYGKEINPNISYNGFITGEDKTVLTKQVTVGGYSAKPNAGEYNITLIGAEAANYDISYTGATLTVNKKDITVTALKVFDKVADETTNATINTSSLVFDGMILGDDVSINLENATATFTQAEVGENIAVNVTGLALTGADAGNYNLTNNEISTTANIKDSVTAADIAAQINAASVVTDSTEIKLPNVPTGYKIVVKSSDNEDVLKTDGTVAPVESNTNVKLTFSIVNENDETDVAETGEITVTVPASTKVKVDVTAEANGNVTGSGEYLKNAEVTVVATPDSGYKFDGWYNGDTSVSTSATYTFKAESDITLVAKFSRKSTGGGGGSRVSTYTVKFETNGGSKVESVKVDKNKTVTEPTAPTKDGFEFAGWYTDKSLTTKYDFSEKVTKGITLYAAWTEKKNEVEDDNTEPTKPTTPETKITFTDVKENDWFAENVKYVVENGLMNGTTETEFAPNDNLTRAMLVTILYRAVGEPEVNKSMPFADVTADSYYANAVIWAQQNGIVSGVNENEFAPDENITREQIATIIYRYANFKEYDTSAKADISAYTDADEISDYATEAMQYAVASGLIKGKTETTLNPQDNATRAEIAAILQRFIKVNK